MSHSEEMLEKIRAHKKKGFSATESGIALGLSRGAVMGLRHRLGLTDPTVAAAQAVHRAGAQIARAKKKEKPMPVQETPQEALPLLKLKGRHCRWPISGEGADTFFCAHQRTEESPYCESHRVLAKGKKSLDEISTKHRAYKGNQPNFAFPRSLGGGNKTPVKGTA